MYLVSLRSEHVADRLVLDDPSRDTTDLPACGEVKILKAGDQVAASKRLTCGFAYL